jgi:hypothetical protein
VAVEKLHFSQDSENLGDRKCLGKSRKSFVGLPGAKFFRPVLRDRVFQHPRDFSPAAKQPEIVLAGIMALVKP